MMTRRGVTLLELLLAIALLLAMGALVMPALFDRLGERAFESSAEIVRSQLLLARAHAQTTGEPIEVWFASDPSRVVARRFDPETAMLESPDDGGGPGPGTARSELPSGPEEDEGAALDPLLLPEPWADRPLADGVWITDRQEDVAEGTTEAPSLVAADERPQSIRIALFMPDGSAVLADPVWFADEHGRRGRLTVNRWTGLASFEQIARSLDERPEAAHEAPAQDEDEPADPARPEVEPEDSAEEEPQ
jgi:type II secretory pathway pseudopilin PulG